MNMTLANETMSDLVPSFFGLALSTHRVLMKKVGGGSVAGDHRAGSTADDGFLPISSSFPYEATIAAIAICFFRLTVRWQKQEPAVLRWFFCGLLAALAFTQKSYELLAAVEIFSYMVSWLSLRPPLFPTSITPQQQPIVRLLSIAVGALASMLIAHGIFGSGLLLKLLGLLTPSFVVQTLEYLFPITEMVAAYDIMEQLALEPDMYRRMIQHLFFVTFHIQVGMGFIGIDFLRNEQSRRNLLIRLDVHEKEDEGSSPKQNNNGASSGGGDANGDDETSAKRLSERSRKFQRGAAPFIFKVAFPYMIQIIIYGNINQFAFSCVHDEMHRTIRFRQVFEHDNHLTAMATDSPTSPEAYATSMNKVVSTVYEIFNRKLFSLPKVLLLPGVMSRQPMLVVTVFPFIFLSDWVKASAVSYMTTQIETLQKEIQDLTAVRSKVEAFDIKNAELLQRSGKFATQFTERRWEDLTVKVQARVVVSELLTRSKGFFAFMQRNFVFTVLIDCALANLIVASKIIPSETFVFSRAIEDAVDMVLMRSRSEAELARMMTEIEKLEKLNQLWLNSKVPNLLHCRVEEGRLLASGARENKLVFRNLHYSRGTAQARGDHIELYSGVYALTGSNGSGKSTLFRILMSCDTNEKSIALPSSINLLTPAEPLAEEDDLFRDTACLADDDEEATDEDESCVAGTNNGNRSLKTDGDSGSEIMPHQIPRFSITVPSKHVVEISQNFYWPLYSKPIDWIFQEHVSEAEGSPEVQKRVRRVAEELHSLEFFQASQNVQDGETESTNTTDSEEAEQDLKQVSEASSAEATIQKIMSELQEEKEDWFSDLSGGQKSKVELVRTVFLRESCPDVLLVDETMAPLDPASKELVMAKLKLFCSESIIIVIYHTDVGQGREVDGKLVECVPSNDFFNKNIHLEKGMIHIRETC